MWNHCSHGLNKFCCLSPFAVVHIPYPGILERLFRATMLNLSRIDRSERVFLGELMINCALCCFSFW